MKTIMIAAAMSLMLAPSAYAAAPVAATPPRRQLSPARLQRTEPFCWPPDATGTGRSDCRATTVSFRARPLVSRLRLSLAVQT